MSRNEIVEAVADYYGIDYDDIDKKDNGDYDIRNDYNFQAGCSMGNGTWLNLESVVKCIESILED